MRLSFQINSTYHKRPFYLVQKSGESVLDKMESMYCSPFLLLSTANRGFPDGIVVKNPPANAEHTGSNPGPGRSHMPQSNPAERLSPCATTTEPTCHNY